MPGLSSMTRDLQCLKKPLAFKISSKLPEKSTNKYRYRYTTIKIPDLSILVTCTELRGENFELHAGVSGRHQESRRQRSIPIAFQLVVVCAFVAAAATAQTAAADHDAVRTAAAPVSRKTTATVLTYPSQFKHLKKKIIGGE
jgi:hypothetical protein